MEERRTTDGSRTPEKVLLIESGNDVVIKDANSEECSNVKFIGRRVTLFKGEEVNLMFMSFVNVKFRSVATIAFIVT